MERSFPRTFDSLPGLVGLVAEFFEKERIPENHRFAVDLAIEEIFTNLVKYNPGAREPIQVGLERRDDRLVIRFVDADSAPFDPGSAAEAPVDRPIEERRAGGLGLHLVRRMMDRIDYEHSGRRGTTTLVKKLE